MPEEKETFNYTEAKVPQYTLPDPLKEEDGSANHRSRSVDERSSAGDSTAVRGAGIRAHPDPGIRSTGEHLIRNRHIRG